MRASEIAKLLANDALSICRELYPNGQKDGLEYVIGSLEGESGKSLKIHLSGAKAGVWKDFAGEDGGDLIGLIMRSKQLNLPAACKFALDFLGIEGDDNPNFKTTTNKSYQRPKINPDSTFNDEALNYLTTERKLNLAHLNAFKVYTKGNNYCFPSYIDGEVIRVKSISTKRDDNGKKIINTSKDSEPCLFGWQTYSGTEREVIICEGEIDAITWHQYGFFALSVPNGAQGMSWIECEWDRLERFDEIYISYDMDKVGEKSSLELISRLGNERCKLVNLPYKDANECLQKGISLSSMRNCISKAATRDPEELKDCVIFWEKTFNIIHPTDEKEEGLEIGFEKAKGKILLRPHELSLWTGISGHGKSMLLGQIAIEAMKEAKCLISSFEMKPERTLARMVKQATKQDKPADQLIMKTFGEWAGKIYIYDVYGQAEINKMISVMEYAYKRYGISFYIIDSLMMLNVLGDDYNGQAGFVKKLLAFKEQYKVHVNLVVHPRKKMNELEMIGKLDIKGSSDISNLADNIFSVHRNKTKEQLRQKQYINALTELERGKLQDLEFRGDIVLKCEKQRHGNWEGDIELWYNNLTHRYREFIHE